MTQEVRMTSASGGEKGRKLARHSLIPTRALTALAERYGRGAEKYDDRNWERGYDWSLSYDALQRHLIAFWGGEDYDEETGQHHLSAVMWHATVLYEFTLDHPEYDDRSTAGRTGSIKDAARSISTKIEANLLYGQEAVVTRTGEAILDPQVPQG